MMGDSKGEYRGLAYRNDADLKAGWQSGPPRPRWSRICRSSTRTTISGTRRNAAATSCPTCWPISAAATTSSPRSSSNAAPCTARTAPREMAPVGEVEFVNGIAAMSASGNYGPCRVAEAIIGHADLTLGARCVRCWRPKSRSAAGASAASATACRGTQRGDQAVSPPALCRRIWPASPNSAKASRNSPARPQFRILAVSSATTGRDRSRPSVPRHHHHPQPCRRRARGRALCGPPAGDSCRLAQRYQRTRQMPERQRQAWRHRHDLVRLRLPRTRRAAVVGRPRRRVAAVYRALHRGVRGQPLHVREQLPAGQAVRRLHRAVERVQTHHRGRVGAAKRPRSTAALRHGCIALPRPDPDSAWV